MLTLREELSKTHGIANDGSPFIIAEMSENHNLSLDRVLAIVDAAAETGADAIRIQTIIADSMTLDLSDGEFIITDPRSLWYGRTLYDLYEEAHTPAEWHKPIADYTRERGLLFMSTPFSEDAVDLLGSLDAPIYEIASFEVIDLPLVRRVARNGKPMILSTGMASVVEIDEAVETAIGAGCTNLTLLKCRSPYPASPENTNIVTMPVIGKTFSVYHGLSDHTIGSGVAMAATARGGSVVEKHFILDRSQGGVDSAFSLEPVEFTALVAECKRAAQAIGQVWFRGTASEQAGRKKRRSLYIAQDLKAGDVLTPHNLRRIRPGLGMGPRHYDILRGRRLGRDVRRGAPMSWDLLDKES